MPNGSLVGVTEECFRRTPLSFKHDKQALVFANGSRLPIQGTFTSQGTSPEGSEWAQMPYSGTWYGDSAYLLWKNNVHLYAVEEQSRAIDPCNFSLC